MRKTFEAISLVFIAVLSLIFIANIPNAVAKEIKAISFLRSASSETKCLENYIERVNKNNSSNLKINLLGGPEVIPAREQVQAVKSGVVDLAITPIAYLTGLVPECMAWTLSLDKPWEERSSGFMDLMSSYYEKVNLHLLGTTGRGSKMYFFLNKEVSSPQDLIGLKMRTTSIVSTLLKKLECRGVTVPRGDIYVAMERGVIDGFLSPSDLVINYGQQEVCKAWIDHGFLVSVISWVVNLQTWKELSPDMKNMLNSVMVEVEEDFYPRWFQVSEEAKKKLVEHGVKKIAFSPEDEKFFMNTVYQSYSQDFEKATPENAEKVRQLIKTRLGQ